MRNIVLHIQIAYGVLKKTRNFIFRDHIYIYMRNIVWHIQVLQKAETFIILKARRCQKLKHSPFCRVPCLPKAYRNQANTPSLGIALWNICGISKSVLLRAFEALGAAVCRHAAAILEVGSCSYFDLFLGAEGVA